MRRILGGFVIAPSIKCLWHCLEMFGLYVTLHSDWCSKPQVTKMETCPWLFCTSWEISWNLNWTAPGLLDFERFVEILPGLPQVYWTLQDLLKSWLYFPRFTGQYHTKSPFVDRRFLQRKCHTTWSDFIHWESFHSSEHSLCEFLGCQTNNHVRTTIFK